MNVNIYQLKYEIYKRRQIFLKAECVDCDVSLPTIKQRAKELRTMEGRMKA